MDRRELEEIERFLSQVGRPSLYAYYGLDPADAAPVVEEVLRKRRSWAQGQQSNPKFKTEAMFLIKNNALMRRALLEDPDGYRAHIREDSSQRNLDVLTLFIRGALAGGLLTPAAEAAIRHQGKQLDVSETAVLRRIEEILTELGARREGLAEDDLSTEALAVDHYAILGLATGATAGDVEDAYRARYRWARNLKDLKRSSEILQALDEAWRVLSEPGRRERYDRRRTEILQVSDGVERNYSLLLGLLSGPDDAVTGEAPLPVAQVATVHEVAFPVGRADGTRISLSNSLPDAPRMPSPPAVSGRTIGLAEGPQAVGTLGPRLLVEGPENVSVGGGWTQTWVVRNSGQGRMPGRVTTDRDWLQAEPTRLDPAATRQEVVARVLPGLLPRGHSAGTLTITTDHGERRLLTVHTFRRSWVALAVGAMVLALGAFVALLALLLSPTGTGSPAGEPGLDLRIDPVADRVLVDGVMVGYGRTLFIPRTVPSFALRVEAEGFAPHEALVALGPAEHATRTIALELVDSMTWSPPEGDGIPIPPAVLATLREVGPRLSPCFDGIGGDVSATYSASLTPDGQVRHIEVADAAFDVDATLPCIQRVFRGVRTARFEGGYTKVSLKLNPREGL